MIFDQFQEEEKEGSRSDVDDMFEYKTAKNQNKARFCPGERQVENYLSIFSFDRSLLFHPNNAKGQQYLFGIW